MVIRIGFVFADLYSALTALIFNNYFPFENLSLVYILRPFLLFLFCAEFRL